MVKKGKAPPRRVVTKRRLARWQQERRRRRIIIALGTLVIALVLAIIGYGYYATNISLEDEWLTTVGGTPFYGGDYADALRLYPYSEGSPELPLLILENNELVTQGAIAANISVTDDEVTQAVRLMFETGNQSLTDEEFQVAYQQMLSSMGLSDEEFRWFIAADLLRGKLEEYLMDQVPEIGALVPQVHVQAILVDSEEDAEGVVERLDAGEDFASLAEEYGDGDLGWLPRGILSPLFDEVAFDPDLELDTVSDPFPIDGGYYIMKVLEREEREVEEEVREQLEANAFGYWLDEEWEEKVERDPDLDLEKIYQWALEEIGG